MIKFLLLSCFFFASNCLGEIQIFHNLVKVKNVTIEVENKSGELFVNGFIPRIKFDKGFENEIDIDPSSWKWNIEDAIEEKREIVLVEKGFVLPVGSCFFNVCLDNCCIVKFSCENLRDNYNYLILSKFDENECFLTLNEFLIGSMKEVQAVKLNKQK